MVESWRGNELSLKTNPTIQNVKKSARPPLASSRFHHVFVTVSCWLPFRFVTGKSECHSGSIYFVTAFVHFLAGSISVLLHLRFPFLHFRLRFTFVAAPVEFLSESILLHLHYSSTTLFQFCYNTIKDPFCLQQS